MQTEWLEDFVALIQTGSFSKAAEKRAITHPAFGRRIKALEQWIGAELVSRQQPIRPTNAGKIVLEAAGEILNILSNTKAQLQNPAALATETLKVACGRSLGSNFFPGWYSSVREHNSACRLTVAASATEAAIQRFLAQDADLLLAYKTPMTDLMLPADRYDTLKIGRETIVPVCSRKQPVKAAALRDPRAAVNRIPWLSCAPSLSLKAVITRHLQNLQILAHLHSVFEADNYEIIRGMAAEGIGIAWLPQSVARTAILEKKIQIIDDKILQLPADIILIRRKGDTHPVIQSIWQTQEPA